MTRHLGANGQYVEYVYNAVGSTKFSRIEPVYFLKVCIQLYTLDLYM